LKHPLLPAADTSPDAHEAQIEAYRRMTGAERVQIAFRLTELTRQATMAGIRSRHPEYDDQQVFLALARVRLGDELTRWAWPDRALVDP
jgi:hypothetical protein